MRSILAVAAVLSIAMAGAASGAPQPKPEWLAAWAAAPTPPSPPGSPRPTPSFDNQTLWQMVRVSAGGRQIRLRLSNEYGTAPLQVGSVHVALAGPDGAVLKDADRAVTFGGSPAALVPPGAPLLSDPVDLRVAPLSTLSVRIYLPGETGPCTCHATGAQTGRLSVHGDFTAAEPEFPVQSSFTYRAYLTRVDVMPEAPGQAVVLLGDSITDGAVSSLDKNQRWPDRLAERLVARDGSRRAWGVVNAGISGNRVLADGAGQGALARFDRDVLAVPGAKYVVVLEGVNDLGVAFGPPRPAGNPPAAQLAAPARKPAAEDLIAAYRQLIARAHERGLTIYGATITPYGGAGYYSPEGDAIRSAVNAWIRTSHAFDAVIDFDATWRDPAKPAEIQAGLQAGDHLHGSDAGYRALGDAVDLRLLP